MCLEAVGAVLGAPEITLPASAEALALSSATRKGVVTVGKEAVVPVVVSVVRRGRVVTQSFPD